MNCQEFDELWNDLLDVETAGRTAPRHRPGRPIGPLRPTRERATAAHAQSCPRCRPIHERYERLRQAIRARNDSPRSFPAPSPELVQRILAASVPRARRSGSGVRPCRSGAAQPRWSCWPCPRFPAMESSDGFLSAASRECDSVRQRLRRTDRGCGPSRGRDLSVALADATEATWDLAWTTSGPAARLGRQVIVAASHRKPSAVGPRARGPPRMGLDALAQVLRVVPDVDSGIDAHPGSRRRPLLQRPPPLVLGAPGLRIPPHPVIRKTRQPHSPRRPRREPEMFSAPSSLDSWHPGTIAQPRSGRSCWRS